MSIPRSLRDLVENMVGDHSLESGPAKRRIQITIIRGSGPAVTLSSGAGTKAAAVSNHSQDLVKEYAKYLLSFVKSAEEDEIVTRLTVLRNYVNLFARD